MSLLCFSLRVYCWKPFILFTIWLAATCWLMMISGISDVSTVGLLFWKRAKRSCHYLFYIETWAWSPSDWSKRPSIWIELNRINWLDKMSGWIDYLIGPPSSWTCIWRWILFICKISAWSYILLEILKILIGINLNQSSRHFLLAHQCFISTQTTFVLRTSRTFIYKWVIVRSLINSHRKERLPCL